MKQSKFKALKLITGGFLKVPNYVLENIYSDNPVNIMLGKIYICSLYHAYYADGVIVVNAMPIQCIRGEWITTFRDISNKTGIARSNVGPLLEILVKNDLITTRKFHRFTVITINNYDDLMKAPAAPPRSTPPKTRSQTAAIPQPASRPEYQRLGLN